MNARQRSGTKRRKVENAPTPVENESNLPTEESPTSSKRQKIETENRLRRYRTHMTNGIRDRIDRALHQRLYLLDAINSSAESTSREYKVLGNTGNVYTVIISHIPSCTCPDNAKGHLCKHIIFVLHRVLKVERKSPLIYQEALLTSELREIFSKADSQYNGSYILAEQSIRDAYLAKARGSDTGPTSTTIQQKTITKEDDCPICYESMINDKDNIIFCSQSCGNNMHKNCFEQWRQAKSSMGQSVTCPFCRVEWKTVTNTNNTQNDYINLAAYSTTNEYDEDDDDDHYDDFYRWMLYRRRRRYY